MCNRRIRLFILLLIVISCLCFTGCGNRTILQTEDNAAVKTAGVNNASASSVIKLSQNIKGESEEKNASKVLSGDVGNYLDAADSSTVSEICESTSSKYIYIGDAANGFGIVESSKEELSDIYIKNAGSIIKQQGSSYRAESMSQLEEDAKAILKEISSNHESQEDILITYSGNDNFVASAFGTHTGISSNLDKVHAKGLYDTKGHFKEAGLSLEITNINVERVIESESMARLGIIAMLVSADTKCVKNDGIYSDIPWIPDEGESQNIKYIVKFWADCYGGLLHEVVVEDIEVTGRV